VIGYGQLEIGADLEGNAREQPAGSGQPFTGWAAFR